MNETGLLKRGRAVGLGIPAKAFGLGKVNRNLLVAGLVGMVISLSLNAAEVDIRKLPPPATEKVDFTRDIKPLLENRCAGCHGPERAKSKFRLDKRELALKGGENGIAIVPGRSVKSPLIQYVSGLVRDMEMPPPGKGDPLSAQEIGLLRAWIDQGAQWETGNLSAKTTTRRGTPETRSSNN